MRPAYCAPKIRTWFATLVLFGLLLAGNLTLAATEPALPSPLQPIQRQNKARIDLGKMLFFDRLLSGDGTMSCAVCHIPDQAFSDGRELSGAYPTNKHWRNTPSLINAAYLERFFWDGRSGSLVHQAAGPIESPFEMNANLPFIAAKLAEIPGYREAFQRAFAAEVSRDLLLQALAAFEQTLTVTDSPFDRYLAGDHTALDSSARRGRDLFFGPRGGCSQCHAGPLLTDQKFYNLGVGETETLLKDPQHRTTRRFVLASHGMAMQDQDPGRYLISKKAQDRGAFRTPPLRQVAQTGPYMHNGRFKTLAEVVAFLSNGGGEDPQKSRLLKKRNLSTEEQADLVAFLESLSGTVPMIERPKLPGD